MNVGMQSNKHAVVQTKVNKSLEKSEAEYYTFPNDEKSFFKADLNKMRKLYDNTRAEFFNYENALEQDAPYQDEDQELRKDLLRQLEEIYKEDRQLDQILTMGNEASEFQRNAGTNLRGQRDTIENIAKNTKQARYGLQKANMKIEVIRIRNLLYVGSLYGISVVLFLIII